MVLLWLVVESPTEGATNIQPHAGDRKKAPVGLRNSLENKILIKHGLLWLITIDQTPETTHACLRLRQQQQKVDPVIPSVPLLSNGQHVSTYYVPWDLRLCHFVTTNMSLGS